MKIAILCISLNMGGEARQTLYLARTLQNKGYNVELYTLFFDEVRCVYKELAKSLKIKYLYSNPQEAETKNKAVRILSYLQKTPLFRYFYSFAYQLMYKKMHKQLSNLVDNKVNILNPHGNAFLSAYFAKRRLNVPSVWMCNDVPSRRWEEWRNDNKIPLWKRFLFYIQDRLLRKYIYYQDLIVVLDNMNKRVIKRYFGTDAVVIRSGVDREYIQGVARKYRENLLRRYAAAHPKLLFVGVLAPRRRIEDIIIAMSLLKSKELEITLDIVGSFDHCISYKERLEGLAENLGIKKYVNFLGSLNDEDLIRKYAESDIFIFPTYMQTWGLVVFEAMSASLPVILTNSCGASEVLIDHENSIIVPPKSPQDIANAIQELLDNNKLYYKLSKNGLYFIENNISWDKYGKDMANLFSKILMDYSSL